MEKKKDMKKLHLGCGEKYLEGYWNIDFPPSEHTLQKTSVADEYADILTMTYPKELEEVRLHHVFEHFSKPEACVLLAKWQQALVKNGIVHIEVPDMGRIARVFRNPFLPLRKKCVAERHLFGSHEAQWAVHHAGYSAGLLHYLLAAFGFKAKKTMRSSWKDTRNLAVIAVKEKDMDARRCRIAAERYFRDFLVDGSPSELRLLEIWLETYDTHF